MYMIVYVLGDGIDVCKHDGALKTSTRRWRLGKCQPETTESARRK